MTVEPAQGSGRLHRGFAFHSDTAGFDRVRTSGWFLLRFSDSRIRRHPEEVIAGLLEAIAAAEAR
ncbi:hypothetical protein [Tsukamurella soli]|uniref:DUF559 domain-containing protein n=1 Tax=Tsukamurella soli TaxID=644556 RepID=A0ABP8JFM5_9ACTN